MFVPFESLPSTSKVWVYQSERKLDDTEIDFINKRVREFMNSWQSHGRDLRGSGKVLYNYFLIISVDESFSPSSGCSIDKSVHFVQELEKELDVNFLNRSRQSFLVEDAIQFFPVNEARKVVENGIVTKETRTFNHNIAVKEELDSKWIIPAGESWLAKYFKNHN